MIIFLNYYLQEASKDSHVHRKIVHLSIFLENSIFETEFEINEIFYFYWQI